METWTSEFSQNDKLDRMLLPCEYFRKCKIPAVWTCITTTIAIDKRIQLHTYITDKSIGLQLVYYFYFIDRQQNISKALSPWHCLHSMLFRCWWSTRISMYDRLWLSSDRSSNNLLSAGALDSLSINDPSWNSQKLKLTHKQMGEGHVVVRRSMNLLG